MMVIDYKEELRQIIKLFISEVLILKPQFELQQPTLSSHWKKTDTR